MNISKKIIENINKNDYSTDRIFIQAVEEVLESISPFLEENNKYKNNSLLYRLTTPNKEFKFKVIWVDDNNNIMVNIGYRIQFNNALGPYKGGLRFHPTVNSGILKFLAFEQIFKNSLSDLPIGGGKGGSDFDPKGKSDFEILKFCNAFMKELYQYIGPQIDVPAGDIGVGSREIGYLFGAYKRLTNTYEGVLTGKPIKLSGSLVRTEATGYGCVYFTDEMLSNENIKNLKNRICTVSGSGNVAIFTIEKLYQMGAKPVTCSDSKGSIYDSEGIDLELLKEIKIKKHLSLSHYIKKKTKASYVEIKDYPEDGHFVWTILCDCAFPSATQNELTKVDAQNLINNACISVSEGANMPTTREAISLLQRNNILFAPSKAANGGGVIVSQFEMSQNASIIKWDFKKIDKMLETRMRQVYHTVYDTAEKYGVKGNYVDGANIAGFKKVADAMIAEGF